MACRFFRELFGSKFTKQEVESTKEMKRKLKQAMGTLDELLESDDVTSKAYYKLSEDLKAVWEAFETPEPDPEEVAEHGNGDNEEAASTDEEEDDDEYDDYDTEQFALIMQHQLSKISLELYQTVMTEVMVEEACKVVVNVKQLHPRALIP
jgi:hypothetical protein